MTVGNRGTLPAGVNVRAYTVPLANDETTETTLCVKHSLLADAIKRIHFNESVSRLFE